MNKVFYLASKILSLTFDSVESEGCKSSSAVKECWNPAKFTSRNPLARI